MAKLSTNQVFSAIATLAIALPALLKNYNLIERKGMATSINNPDIGRAEGESLILAIATMILIIALFLSFGFPGIQKNNAAVINVPGSIQVGINK